LVGAFVNRDIDKENKITHSWLIMPQHLVTIIQRMSSVEWEEKLARPMKCDDVGVVMGIATILYLSCN
jgi:hypothetical protein